MNYDGKYWGHCWMCGAAFIEIARDCHVELCPQCDRRAELADYHHRMERDRIARRMIEEALIV